MGSTEPWLISSTRALVDLLPAPSLQAVEGAEHDVPAEVLAAAIRQFASAAPATPVQ